MMSIFARPGRTLGSASVSFAQPSGVSPSPCRKITAALVLFGLLPIPPVVFEADGGVRTVFVEAKADVKRVHIEKLEREQRSTTNTKRRDILLLQ